MNISVLTLNKRKKEKIHDKTEILLKLALNTINQTTLKKKNEKQKTKNKDSIIAELASNASQ